MTFGWPEEPNEHWAGVANRDALGMPSHGGMLMQCQWCAKFGFESDAECEAVRWARSAYWPRWRTRLRTRPETMREDLRHFYYHPFGRADWNEYMKLARRWIARNEKLPSFPEVCPYCAERDANLAMEKAS